MAALVCEICGGKLIGKAGGVFACDSCGMEYSKEWAQEKIQEIRGSVQIEGSVDVTGSTVMVDNTAFVEKYLQNARRAKDKEDWEETEKYYNLVEQNDPTNIEAIFYSAYGKTKSSLLENDVFKREATFKVLQNCVSIIDDNYDVSKESEEILVVEQISKFGFKELPLASDSNEIIFTQRSRQNGCLYYYKEKKTGDLVFFMYLGKSKTNESTTDDIIYAISKKLKKLNNNYNLFSRNDLCILIQEQLDYCVCQAEIIDGLINIFISSAEELYNKTNWINKFDNIFLLFIDNLFCINTKTWEYERKIITKEHIDQVFSNAGL